eukprot:GHVP01031238.1.p1 GENE.GHVP01031238.1~~GHVP01031238.1.p1  ORF type:complete len:226 (+),score=56.56 GHVP01031238.1:23-679(+)
MENEFANFAQIFTQGVNIIGQVDQSEFGTEIQAAAGARGIKSCVQSKAAPLGGAQKRSPPRIQATASKQATAAAAPLRQADAQKKSRATVRQADSRSKVAAAPPRRQVAAGAPGSKVTVDMKGFKDKQKKRLYGAKSTILTQYCTSELTKEEIDELSSKYKMSEEAARREERECEKLYGKTLKEAKIEQQLQVSGAVKDASKEIAAGIETDSGAENDD